MSWRLSYFYENSQLEIRQCNTIMQCAQVMEGLLSIESEFSDRLIYRNFYLHIYHEDFYGLSNNVLHVLETRLFLYVLAT